MKFAVAIVLAVAAVSNAQWSPYWNGWNWNAWNGLNTWNNWATRSLPQFYSAPAIAAAPSPAVAVAPAPFAYAPAFSSGQYHSQDELGQASFGYVHPGQAATNFRDAFGNQAGSWSYVDPEGKTRITNYIADANGFRVVSNNLPEGPSADLALPQPVQDTAEVVAAKAAHLAAFKAAESGVIVPVNTLPAPQPVQDTAEVAAAKAEHAKAWEAAKAAADAAPERKKRHVLAYSGALPYPYASVLPYTTPLAYSAPLSVVPKATLAYTVPSVPVREATLTKTILTPGHAVAYRVD